MNRITANLNTEALKQLIVRGMQEKKASDIAILDLRSIKNAFADYMVICSGNSDTQVDAITTSIEDEVYKGVKLNVWHKEGKANKEWILLDYADIVAHVFKKDKRRHYGLEDLWGDAEINFIEDDVFTAKP
jgi:ribosome-associated protein